jgi:lipid II:glycine glycyltransferase (peptidoglycan interpeptide bridge formation enzyme)
MKIRLETASAEFCDSSQAFLQSGFWGSFKSEFGWKARHFSLGFEASSSSLLVLERRLARGFSFAYVPHGPECDFAEIDRAEALSALAASIRPFLPHGCLFLRFDPPWYLAEERAAAAERADGGASRGGGPGDDRTPRDGALPEGIAENGSAAVGGTEGDVPSEPMRPRLGKPLVRAAADVQPPDTVLLDLDKSEEELLGAMKPKWRYNIRLAEKKGVVIEEAGLEDLGEFYRLYRATALRDRIALHPQRYYERLFALASGYPRAPSRPAPDIRLWIARHEGEALAAIVTLFRGEEAVYLYGASSDSKRNLMPAYALQWAAIRAAKAALCREYDFFGIPPSDDQNHPMAGLYRFKTGFGGRIVHRAGSWDYPLHPVAYRAFRAAEEARRWWFKDFKKRRA